MRRPLVIAAQEVAVVGAALGCVLLSHPTGFPWSEQAAILACLALPLRLKWPWLAMIFCLWALSGELGLAPALVGLYRVGRTARSPWVTGAWALASVVAVETTVFGLTPLNVRDGTLSVLFTVLWMLSPSALGMLVTTRVRLAASLRELRLAREAELETRANKARSAERSRIGREIHDAVGHHATLIAVEAAALEATSAEPQTKAAAGRIRALAKASLAEMRTALGLVGGRSEGGSGLPDVASLVAEAQQAGMRVELEAPAEVDVLPAVSRAAFRIVQESLTNAAKHAPGAPVEVTIAPEPDGLAVTITSGPPAQPPPTPDSGGHGLTGMAERATIVGGTLDVETQDEGTFTVRARLPLERYIAAKVAQPDPTIDGSQRAVDVR
ncbi:MAG TPA: histidine kinase [Pseudonocardiaceae bacterium]|nr:histidine kinase [Pseudonocardiaceae bacterium]